MFEIIGTNNNCNKFVSGFSSVVCLTPLVLFSRLSIHLMNLKLYCNSFDVILETFRYGFVDYSTLFSQNCDVNSSLINE